MNSDYGGIATLNNSLDTYTPNRASTLDNLLLSSNQHSINDTLKNSQINHTLIGIVAEENNKCPSGYGVREHVDGNIILVIVDTETGSKQYITKDLGPKKEGGGRPGVNLIEYIKANYPNLEILITGKKLEVDTGKIKNEPKPPGTDIDDIYEVELEEKETTDDSEVLEYAIEPDENYDTEEQPLDVESNLDAELVAAECESESSESTE